MTKVAYFIFPIFAKLMDQNNSYISVAVKIAKIFFVGLHFHMYTSVWVHTRHICHVLKQLGGLSTVTHKHPISYRKILSQRMCTQAEKLLHEMTMGPNGATFR